MGVNWIDTTRLSFRSLLLFERLQIGRLEGYLPENDLAIALKANPEVDWFFRHKCPEISPYLDKVIKLALLEANTNNVREAEQRILAKLNDWLTYVIDPTIYDRQPFLGWDSNELLSVVDFTGKVVLDIGSGTGRLAFIAAPQAKAVYAVEPVENLRSYLWSKAARADIRNLFVVDGLITMIPFQNSFADVTMAGHVFGEYPKEENAEMERVTKKRGMVIYCPGNNDEDNPEHQFLVNQGYKWLRFEEPVDGWKRKYWKRV